MTREQRKKNAFKIKKTRILKINLIELNSLASLWIISPTSYIQKKTIINAGSGRNDK